MPRWIRFTCSGTGCCGPSMLQPAVVLFALQPKTHTVISVSAAQPTGFIGLRPNDKAVPRLAFATRNRWIVGQLHFGLITRRHRHHAENWKQGSRRNDERKRN